MNPNANWQRVRTADGEVILVAKFDAVVNGEFDAYLDPTLAASNPGSHEYLCLNDLLTYESWGVTKTFRVGVRQHANIPIVESSACLLTGRGDLALFGLGAAAVLDGTHLGAWNMASALFCDASQQVFYKNLSFGGITSAIQNGGVMHMDNCDINSPINPTAVNIFTSTFRNCRFSSSVFLQSSGSTNATFIGCDILGHLDISTGVVCRFIGGSIGRTGGSNITIHNSGVGIISGDLYSNLIISTSATQACVVHNTGGVGAGVTVSATAPQVAVTGDWADVTFSGTPAATSPRRFSGSCESLDFAGPGKVDVQNTLQNFSRKVTLRGNGIHASLHMAQGPISCVGVTNSRIDAQMTGAGGGFTLDVASANNLVTLSGHNGGTFGGITNSGTNNRIITEDTDSYLVPLTNSHIFVGNASNVAVDVAMSGDVTITNAGATAIGAAKVTNAMLAGSIDLTTKVTGILPVANGGSGANSLPANQLLAGNGASPITGIPAGTNGQLLIGQTSLAPSFISVTGDVTITAAGVTTLKNTGPGAIGPIGDSTHVAAVTLDAQGRVTTLTSVAIAAATATDEGLLLMGWYA